MPLIVTRRDPQTHVTKKFFTVSAYTGEDDVVTEKVTPDTPTEKVEPVVEVQLKDEKGHTVATRFEEKEKPEPEVVPEEQLDKYFTEQDRYELTPENIRRNEDARFLSEDIAEPHTSIYGKEVDLGSTEQDLNQAAGGWTTALYHKFFGKKQ